MISFSFDPVIGPSRELCPPRSMFRQLREATLRTGSGLPHGTAETGGDKPAPMSAIAYESARNAASGLAPNARITSRLDRTNAPMPDVVQLPCRIQMTLGGGPHTKLIRWKSESFETMLRLWSSA